MTEDKLIADFMDWFTNETDADYWDEGPLQSVEKKLRELLTKSKGDNMTEQPEQKPVEVEDIEVDEDEDEDEDEDDGDTIVGDDENSSEG